MIKHLLTMLLCIGSISFATAQLTLPPSGNNQKSAVKQYIGAVAHVSVVYNSPDVTSPSGESRTGEIWGKLVPYGQAANNFGTAKEIPWRAGANENTVIKFSHDVLIQGKALKAGKYGFHVIPKENGPWTLIFSTNTSSWGSYYYDAKEDALRVEATPENHAYNEWLTFEFIDRQPTFTVLALRWENMSLPFKIEVPNVKDLHIAKIREELRSDKGFTWVNWNTAVNYCLQADTNLEEALTWADQAISAPFIGQENFTTLQTKSLVLTKLDRKAEAEEVMAKAIKHPTATPFQIHAYGRQLIGMGEKDKALEIFTYNMKKYEEAWPTHVGMARAYSALGKYDKALKHAELALAQAPDQLNKDNLVKSIDLLKSGKDIN